MSNRRPCVRCHRSIDRSARSCVYCNWDQTVLPMAKAAPDGAAEPVDVSRAHARNRNLALGAGALVALLIAAFSVGAVIHRVDVDRMKTANNAKVSAALPAGNAPAPSRSDIEIVPATGSTNAIGEQPITSAPATTTSQGVSNEYQRNDATAATADEYAQLAARARAEKQNVDVDPRTVGGPAYGGASTRSRRSNLATDAGTDIPLTNDNGNANGRASGEPQASRIMIRTKAVAEYQPVPMIHVDHDVTARLDLTIGPDGHVQDVAVLNAIPGETARLIAVVRSWRFKPATENGAPVSSHFSVDISFKADE